MTGLALGYILTRSRYGFAGGFKRIYVTGEGSLSTALLVMFALAMVLAAGIQWSATMSGADVPGLSSVKFFKHLYFTGRVYLWHRDDAGRRLCVRNAQ